MSNPMMFGLIPAMTIVAFVLSILAYTRKREFIVKDENGEHVTVKSWHNSDVGKDFMSDYLTNTLTYGGDPKSKPMYTHTKGYIEKQGNEGRKIFLQ